MFSSFFGMQGDLMICAIIPEGKIVPIGIAAVGFDRLNPAEPPRIALF